MNIGTTGGFSMMPPVVKNLIIINVIFFVAFNLVMPSLAPYFSLFHWDSPLYKPWQILTHQFMHADFMHILFNMFALWMLGVAVENALGSQRFLMFYLICGFGAALLHLLVFSWENQDFIYIFKHLSESEQINVANYVWQEMNFGTGNLASVSQLSSQEIRSGVPMATAMVGASGAIYGVLFAFGYLFPNVRLMIYFLFPIKAKYFVAILAVIALFAGLNGNPADNVAHFAHLGGMVFAFLLFKYWKIKPGGFNRWD